MNNINAQNQNGVEQAPQPRSNKLKKVIAAVALSGVALFGAHEVASGNDSNPKPTAERTVTPNVPQAAEQHKPLKETYANIERSGTTFIVEAGISAKDSADIPESGIVDVDGVMHNDTAFFQLSAASAMNIDPANVRVTSLSHPDMEVVLTRNDDEYMGDEAADTGETTDFAYYEIENPKQYGDISISIVGSFDSNSSDNPEDIRMNYNIGGKLDPVSQ